MKITENYSSLESQLFSFSYAQKKTTPDFMKIRFPCCEPPLPVLRMCQTFLICEDMLGQFT